MSAVIDYNAFRAFQSAAKQAKRLGAPQREAVHAVAIAQRNGNTGFHVAGQLQHRAIRREQPTGPEAA
jgi:hypothetical protein